MDEQINQELEQVPSEPTESVEVKTSEITEEEMSIIAQAKQEKARKDCAAEVDAVLKKYGMTLVPTGIAVVENNK